MQAAQGEYFIGSEKIYKIGKIYTQYYNIDINKVKEILKITCTRSLVPEPLRLAHLIASGIVDGQSRGRA